MKLRTQITAIGLAGALFSGVVGGIGLLTSSWLGSAIDDSIRTGTSLQASQVADMMHDAIRGDVQMALLGAVDNRPEQVAEAQDGLKEHADTFNKALASLHTLSLTKDSEDALLDAEPLVKEYIGVAEKMISAAGISAQAGMQHMPALQAVFGDLEARMAALSDAITNSGDQVNKRAKESVGRAWLTISLVMVLALATMVVASLWLADRLAQPMAHAVAVADRLAQGDLTAEIHPAGNDETVLLLQGMARMQASFVDIVRAVQTNADSVATGSSQIAQGNQDLSQRTEEQASALEETAASMEQLGATVKQNADNAQQANQLALGASTVAIKGGEVVGQVVSTMRDINDSSKKIADIIAVIDGIAFQTNILALNAAVEAARAGEQGRGFAVVASEVRSLAGRSAEAAREIKVLIGASVERVEQGTALVDQAGATMTEVVSSIKRVTDIMGEISAAATEQSAGVAQVGDAVSQMDQVTQQNAALVEESAAAAESLTQQAQQLVQAVAVFKLAHGSQGYAPAPVVQVSPALPVVERRAPNRAKNVARLTSVTKAPAAPAPAKTGTDDDWTSF